MVTFREARALVADQLRPEWPTQLGNFYVDPEGWESATHYRVIVGAAEYLRDGDEDFVEFDAPTIVVEKATGRVESLPWTEGVDGAYSPRKMRPVTDPKG